MSPNRSQIDQKSTKNRPTSIKNRSNIDQKLKFKIGCLLASILDPFLIDFDGFGEASWEGQSSQEPSKMAPKKQWKNERPWSKNRPPDLPKSAPRVLASRPVPPQTPPCLSFGNKRNSNQPSACFPSSTKNRCQEAPHLGLQILIDFWSISGANFDPQNP